LRHGYGFTEESKTGNVVPLSLEKDEWMKYPLFLLALAVFAVSAQGWQEITVNGFTLRWATVSGGNLSVELNAPTTGWVSVGFAPTNMMLNANIVIGYVSSGTQALQDNFGVSPEIHIEDVLLGGTSDVTIDAGGFEAGGSTELHFTIPLNSGDQYDRVLVPGNTYPVIFAMGGNGQDNFSSMHTAFGYSSITIEQLSFEPSTWAEIKTIWTEPN